MNYHNRVMPADEVQSADPLVRIEARLAVLNATLTALQKEQEYQRGRAAALLYLLGPRRRH